VVISNHARRKATRQGRNIGETDMTQERMINLAKAHGFTASASGTGIIVNIPWYNPTTKDEGADAIYCADMAALRIELGY
jgi:hypothetical protein